MEEQKESEPLSITLRRVREGMGLTQEQWAARLGVTARTVARWEAGEAEPRGAARSAINAATGGAVAAGAALGLTSAFAAPVVGAAVALGAAAAFGSRWLAGRTDVAKARSEALAALEEQARASGVDWPTFQRQTRATLATAKALGMDLEQLLDLLGGSSSSR